MGMPEKLKLHYRSKLQRSRRRKAPRVSEMCIDALVACTTCRNRMHLTGSSIFKCMQCMHELTAEQVLAVLETSR